MHHDDRRRPTRTTTSIAVALGLLALTSVASQAQTVTSGLVTTRESLEAVRYKSLANTGSREIYLGVPDIGIGSHRTERDVTWAATNDLTFVYDRPNDKLTATVSNVNGVYTLDYPSISTQLGVFGKTFTVDDLDFMQISVFARHTGVTVAFNSVELDSIPLGSFSAAAVATNHWMVSGYDFSPGFTVTGKLVLTGTFSGGDELSKLELTVGKANVCGNGILELTEQCDDSNTLNGDCCSSACQYDSAGTACTSDGNVCTDNECNGSGTCLTTNNTDPCTDGDPCTVNDICAAGVCTSDPACGNGTVEGACGEECDPPNGLTCDATCQSLALCGNGVLEPLEACDDGNTLAGDCCDAVCQVEVGPCDDGDSCTTGDVCTPSGCDGTPLDCSHLDSDCTSGQCDAFNGECVSVSVNEGAPCDDGNPCSASDVCLTGICSACGNNTIDGACGETCDPPAAGVCDPTCLAVACGNDVVQAGEECDDGNATSGDGCSSACLFEDKVCIEGLQPSVARAAKRVAFASDYDYVGGNADGNQEIYLFERKRFDKALKRLVKKQGLDLLAAKNQLLTTAASTYFFQLTDTVLPVVNEFPTVSGSGRVVAFVSNGDVTPGAPGNADGNREIYRMDAKRALRGETDATVQVTDSPVGVDNLNPNLRAYSNFLAFDSNGDLVPGRCVGGIDDFETCTTNGDCAANACGNPEQNREMFLHVQSVFVGGGESLRQLTQSATGETVVGQSQNFRTGATAISSNANLLGVNPEFNREIYQISNTPDSLIAVTTTASGQHEEAAQAVKTRIAFTSNGNLSALNADGNREIVFYDDNAVPAYSQAGESTGCYNAMPSIDSRGRYVAFHSSCNRIASLGNPDQSIFVWDDKKSKFLPLVMRGEASAASANPQATSRLGVFTYESNLGSVVDPAICFLNVRSFLKTLGQ